MSLSFMLLKLAPQVFHTGDQLVAFYHDFIMRNPHNQVLIDDGSLQGVCHSRC